MLKHYLTLAFRNLWKNKTYSFLNIFGLAVGIACAGLIFLWVEDELNFDQVHQKKDRVYSVRDNWLYAGSIRSITSTPALLGETIKTDIPGIEHAARTSEGDQLLFSIGDKSFYASGLFSDPSLFDIFTISFVEGNATAALRSLNSMVLTETLAKKLFPLDAVHQKDAMEKIIGKTITINNKDHYVISAVVKDPPINSSIQFQWLASFQIPLSSNSSMLNWGNMNTLTYVELKKDVDPVAIDRILKNYIQQKSSDADEHAFLFPMNRWHLYDEFENGHPTGKGRIVQIKNLSLIAWIILLIACINFMNLSTARSEKKAREVGVKKVLGAGRGRLVAQFLGESLLLSFMAALIALGIIFLLLPVFNSLVEKNLTIALGNPIHDLALLFIALICGLIAGSYPSLYLSSFKPILVLKGFKSKNSTAVWIRKSLVVLQFTASIVFILGTITISREIQYVKNRKLGFDKDHLVEINTQSDLAQKFPVMKEELLHTGLIENAALSDHSTIYDGNSSDDLSWQGKTPDEKILISRRSVTPGFLATSGMTILEGRDFQFNVASDSLNVIITESMATILGKGSALNKTINARSWNLPKLNVIGVIKDYVYGDIYGKPDPVIFLSTQLYRNTLYVRIKAHNDQEQALAKIESIVKKYNPQYPFEYRFVDAQFNALFHAEILMSHLSIIFSTLAILISCLGLFGLATYMAEQRTKEIGIRKVLGASVQGIAALLSKDFLKLVGISCLVAFPIAWWMMHNWLQSYTYRIQISWWMFLAAGTAAGLIALLTIGFQAIKAAMANPATSLRSE